MPTHIVMVYFSKLVKSRRAPEMLFIISFSEFCVSANVLFILSALVTEPVDFSSDIAGVEDTAVRKLLLSLPETVRKFVLSMGVFQIIPIVL